MEIISKDKPKGLAYSKNKKLKKAKRLEEEKKFKRLTENKRKNAESRKERAIEKESIDKISEVAILGYNKGMLLINIEGKEEKRALLFDKKAVTKSNLEREIRNFEVKLYGDNWKISILKGFQEMKDELIWKLSEEI
ncbi:MULTISPECIES: hypothetical protein [Fusobacterium]|jgi:hypothetical protein|uniref:Uncharacterized protein n=2 Tax=Fusobacterium ulcerans TaxID=861 RepID=A0AAX1TTS5_9FUSO|nr:MULTISPECIES: hypothetical protein [Fusobacterium]AVQ27277.1 hypothetical protein C4N20_03920 [Fusobacterium ulcerans]EFS24590.1 hypothetical protein FUAG_00105 [Fusobacterium ulcerans ATCC 49185]EHO83112.1 hypothetical protein HMPREF0402_01142 [Fusobacterium ulcerans 12-1B]MCB8565968.1 hypothetical protein [Fusobacterium ulcerans]MCB8647949.1 hypothetical protein [Fusobacterium ulcerans]